MSERVHGGDWAAYEAAYGRKPLDFSASIGPLPMPAAALAAAKEALGWQDRYPDPKQRELRHAISSAWSLPEEWILCGNGAADLIWRLAFAFRGGKALICAPAFGEYQRALEAAGCEVRVYRMDQSDGGHRGGCPDQAVCGHRGDYPDQLGCGNRGGQNCTVREFVIGRDMLGHLTPDLDLVFLCEPNNPSGNVTDRELILAIASRCRANKTLLVIDESFHDFLDQEKHRSMLEMLGQQPVLVIRSFTKFYAMAAMRLGWCACSDRAVLEKMTDSGQPWAVSAAAAAAGIAALSDTAYPENVRSLVKREREALKTALRRLGCRVVSGEANYLLFWDETPGLRKRLMDRGIMIRDCSDFEGLGKGWYRIAVRTPEENSILIREMEAVRDLT